MLEADWVGPSKVWGPEGHNSFGFQAYGSLGSEATDLQGFSCDSKPWPSQAPSLQNGSRHQSPKPQNLAQPKPYSWNTPHSDVYVPHRRSSCFRSTQFLALPRPELVVMGFPTCRKLIKKPLALCRVLHRGSFTVGIQTQGSHNQVPTFSFAYGSGAACHRADGRIF